MTVRYTDWKLTAAQLDEASRLHEQGMTDHVIGQAMLGKGYTHAQRVQCGQDAVAAARTQERIRDESTSTPPRYLTGERTWTRHHFTRSELRAIVRWRSEGNSFTAIGTRLDRFAHLPPRQRAEAAYEGFIAALHVLYPCAIPWNVRTGDIDAGGVLSADERALRATTEYMSPPPAASAPAPRTRPAAIRAAIAAALTEYNRRMADINRRPQ